MKRQTLSMLRQPTALSASKPSRQRALAPVLRPWASLSGAVVLSASLVLAACSPSSRPPAETSAVPAPAAATPAADAPQVVATASVICDMAQQIAGTTINLTCLVQPGVDPHVYEATPSDRRAIEDADLVLYSGYDYEPELIRMVAATNTPAPKIAVLEQALPNPLMGSAHDHSHEHADEKAEAHDHGHDQGAENAEAHDHDSEMAAAGEEQVPDPHIWHDPENGVRMVKVISDQLEALVPANAQVYNERETAIAQQLTQINDWLKTQVATVPQTSRKLVTPHDSFRYFAQAFGFEVKGTIEGLSTEERPSASRLAEIVDLVKTAQVPAIFSEKTTNPQLIQAVARDANVLVAEQPLFVEGPGGSDSIAPTYQTMLVSNTCTIVNALGGTCDPATAPQ